VGHSRVRLKSLIGSLEERGWELRRVLQSVCKVKFVANCAREAWGPFIAAEGNLAVGVSETRTCPDRGLDIYGHCLYNPAVKSDKAG
jgi:hypothetical protein